VNDVRMAARARGGGVARRGTSTSRGSGASIMRENHMENTQRLGAVKGYQQ